MLIRINDANNGAIGRRLFAFERKARFLAPAPENQFADSGARGVDRHQRFSLWRQVFIKGLNDKQFPILKRIVLNRGHNCSDYACELHIKSVWSLKESVILSLKSNLASKLLDSRLRTHYVHGVDHADDRGVDWRVFHVLRQPGA